MIFGFQPTQPRKPSAMESSRSAATTDEAYVKAYQRLMDRLETEAKQKQHDDQAYQTQLQLIKDQERRERLQNKQLQQAHAEILRRQAEDNHKKRLKQRSFDLSPAFDLKSFPLPTSEENSLKSQKQQMMARDLEQQLRDKHQRRAEMKHLTTEYDAFQVSAWKSQNEMLRLQEIQERQRVKDDLTKSWSDNQRARTIMKFLEGKAKVNPLSEASQASELASLRSSPVRRPESIQVTPVEHIEIRPDNPKPNRLANQAPDFTPTSRRELALQLQAQIRQNEINSLQAQISTKANRLSSHSPTSDYNKKLMDEAAVLLVRSMQSRVQREGTIRRTKPKAYPLDAAYKTPSSVRQSVNRSFSQYGRQVVTRSDT